jgi:hypothetical protein
MQTYQVEGLGILKNGNAVIEPHLTGENMKAILAIFRGKARLAGAPAQVFETTTTIAATTTTTASTSSSPDSIAPATTTTIKPVPTTTTVALPDSGATEIVKGIVPPKDVVCP